MSQAQELIVSKPYPWQNNNFEHIAGLWQKQKLPHALLVTGESGLGKLHFAKAFSQYVFCQSVKLKQSKEACGTCKECLLFAAGTHPDLLMVRLEEKETKGKKTKAKQIKVEQIRQLIDFVTKTSHRGGMKVIIIEPAEAMNTSAANALLKSLEEPADQTLIFLITHAAHRLLPTIRSRCQTIAVDKPSHAEAVSWLSGHINDSDKVEQLLAIANNSPLQAKRLDEADFLAVYNHVVQFILQASKGQANPILTAEKFNKLDVLLIMQALQQLLWDLIKLSQSLPLAATHPLLALSEQCQKSGFSKRAYLMLEEFQQANYEISGVTNPNPQLLLESLLVRFSALIRA